MHAFEIEPRRNGCHSKRNYIYPSLSPAKYNILQNSKIKNMIVINISNP